MLYQIATHKHTHACLGFVGETIILLTLNLTILCHLQVSALRKSCRKISPFPLANLSRGAAFEYLIPRTEFWPSPQGKCYDHQQGKLDPFQIKSLPAESQLREWAKHIHGPNQYVQTSRGKVDNDCLNILRRFHTMRSIQDDVQQEVGWFSSPCNRPETVVEHPTATQIAVLQEFLYCGRYDEIREPYGMSANELAMVCADRWISSDHICWLMKTLNQDQDETFFVYLNGISKDPATLQRFTKCSSKPSKLCFAINVCKNQTGQTFIGSDFQPFPTIKSVYY